jgi:hypothetical protein
MSCSGSWLNLALVDVNQVIDEEPLRLPLLNIEGDWSALRGFMSSVRTALGDLRPNHLAFLLPEMTYKNNYAFFDDRVGTEVLVRVVAAEEGMTFVRVKRPTVRSTLGLIKKGALSDAGAIMGLKVGKYWAEGRDLAALAAFTLLKGR